MEKLANIQQELNALNTKNTELQREMEKERAAFVLDKKTLEDTIVDITNTQASSRVDQEAHEKEISEHADRSRVGPAELV